MRPPLEIAGVSLTPGMLLWALGRAHLYAVASGLSYGLTDGKDKTAEHFANRYSGLVKRLIKRLDRILQEIEE